MSKTGDREVSSAGVLVFDDKGRILATLRHAGEGLGLPFGSIEPGETSQACAVRETLEETGRVVQLLNFPPFIHEARGGKFAATYLARICSEYIHPNEGVGAWVNPEQICIGAFADYNLQMMKHFGVL